jgi:hypothetical protein
MPRLTQARQQWLKERNAQIVKFFLTGKSMEEVGKNFNLTRQRIEQILKELGVTERWLWAKPKLTPLTPEEKLAIRTAQFWEKVDIKLDPNECWLWKGYIDAGGYGVTSWENNKIYAHRLSWQLHHKRTTENKLSFACKNRICCNPLHLKVNSNNK